jgi:putative ABC transport system substrate-binding protein
MRRRKFLALFGGTAVASALFRPPAGWAQQRDRVRRIGVLMGVAENDPDAPTRVNAFQQGLQEAGWTVGGNLWVDYRWAAGDRERMRVLAAELVALKPDVIVANTTPVTIALQQATSSIPIVFAQVVDPLGRGFADNLARPGGNITGFLNFEFSMGGKWVETLKQIAPRVVRVGVLFNPQTAPFGDSFVRVIEAAAIPLKLQVVASRVQNEAEFTPAIAAIAAHPDSGLIVLPDIFTTSHRETIVALAASHRLPAVYPFRYFALSGGLVSDGVDGADLFRRTAGYVDRILNGAKPGDLPVQGPNKFELVINFKTAKALGLEMPPTLLARADEVIE